MHPRELSTHSNGKTNSIPELLEIVLIMKSEHFNETACIKHAQPGKSHRIHYTKAMDHTSSCITLIYCASPF
jgi:hypothetical protein